MPLTTAGLDLPTIDEVVEAIEEDQRAALGEALDQGPRSVLGQLNAVIANQLRLVLEDLAAVYDSTDPDLASGAALDRLCALTGTTRLDATRSVVEVDVTLDAGTTVPAGDLVLAVSGATSRTFKNRAELSNPGGAPAVVSGTFDALALGAVEAPAGTLTVISQPVAGVTAATNPLDAVVGREIETDAGLRVRRETELFRPGTGTVDAIRVDVLDAVPALVSVSVFENPTDVVDVDGLPPHSIEVLAYDGTPTGTAVDDDQLAQAIWEAKPAGIATHGSSSGTAADSLGVSRVVLFSRPALIELHVRVEVTVSSDWTSPDDDDALKSRVAEFGNGLAVGDDVVVSQLIAYVLRPDDTPTQGVESRVLDVTAVGVDVVAPPGATGNYVVDVRELADLDTSRVVVVVTTA